MVMIVVLQYCAACLCPCGERVTSSVVALRNCSGFRDIRKQSFWFGLLWDPSFLCVVCCVAEASAVGVGPYEVDQSESNVPRETFPLSEQFIPISSLVIVFDPVTYHLVAECISSSESH